MRKVKRPKNFLGSVGAERFKAPVKLVAAGCRVSQGASRAEVGGRAHGEGPCGPGLIRFEL